MRSYGSIGDVEFWFDWSDNGIEMEAGVEGSDVNLLPVLDRLPGVDYDSLIQDAWEDFVERYPHRALEMVR